MVAGHGRRKGGNRRMRQRLMKDAARRGWTDADILARSVDEAEDERT